MRDILRRLERIEAARVGTTADRGRLSALILDRCRELGVPDADLYDEAARLMVESIIAGIRE